MDWCFQIPCLKESWMRLQFEYLFGVKFSECCSWQHLERVLGGIYTKKAPCHPPLQNGSGTAYHTRSLKKLTCYVSLLLPSHAVDKLPCVAGLACAVSWFLLVVKAQFQPTLRVLNTNLCLNSSANISSLLLVHCRRITHMTHQNGIICVPFALQSVCTASSSQII